MRADVEACIGEAILELTDMALKYGEDTPLDPGGFNRIVRTSALELERLRCPRPGAPFTYAVALKVMEALRPLVIDHTVIFISIDLVEAPGVLYPATTPTGFVNFSPWPPDK